MAHLQVNKALFKLELNPTEILTLAQILEFERTTGDFYMSDKQLGENFGVSDKTISRALKVLEDKGYIVRETKNVKGGKERHIKATKDILSIVYKDDKKATTDKKSFIQETKCPLDNGQIDLIKDNTLKDKVKDNCSTPSSWGDAPNPLPIGDNKKEFKF